MPYHDDEPEETHAERLRGCGCVIALLLCGLLMVACAMMAK